VVEAVANFGAQLASQVVPGRAMLIYLDDLKDRAGETTRRLGELADQSARRLEEMEASKAHAEFMEDEAAALEALGMAFGPVVVETKKATKAQSSHTKEVKKGSDETKTALTAEQAARERAHKEQQRFISESIADIDAEFQAEAEAERQLQLLEGDRHEKKKQQRAEEKQMADQRREELEQEMLALADLQGTVVGAMAAFQELKFDETREGAADATDKTDRLKQEIQDLESTVEDANGTERQEIRATIRAKDDELKVAEDEAKKARQRARRQFKDMKALRISETLINGAAAAARAFAELGPIAGAIAATSIGIATAVNVATIKAQKPPKFHDGGMIQPDEQPAILRRGEAVLNERAAQRLGRQTIESLNRDEPLGNVNIYLGEDLLRSQRLQRTLRSGAHSAIGARSPYVGR
jgi:chromosome segregation ATPase